MEVGREAAEEWNLFERIGEDALDYLRLKGEGVGQKGWDGKEGR